MHRGCDRAESADRDYNLNLQAVHKAASVPPLPSGEWVWALRDTPTGTRESHCACMRTSSDVRLLTGINTLIIKHSNNKYPSS